MHRVGRLEIKISCLVNVSFSSFMSLKSLGLAAIKFKWPAAQRVPYFKSTLLNTMHYGRHNLRLGLLFLTQHSLCFP